MSIPPVKSHTRELQSGPDPVIALTAAAFAAAAIIAGVLLYQHNEAVHESLKAFARGLSTQSFWSEPAWA